MKFPFPGSYYFTGAAMPDGSEYYAWEEKVGGAITYAIFVSRLNKAETKFTDKQQVSNEPYGERPFLFYNPTKGKLVLLYQSRDPGTKVVTNYRKTSTDGKVWSAAVAVSTYKERRARK